ncbi:MAG: DUF6923 family protein [Phycisphaerae bacterium]
MNTGHSANPILHCRRVKHPQNATAMFRCRSRRRETEPRDHGGLRQDNLRARTTATHRNGISACIVAVATAAALTAPATCWADPPTIDGSRDAAYSSPRALQDTPTGFGNATLGQIDLANGSELDAAYDFVQDGVLYLFFAGNLESNFNKLELFIDSRPGGQNQLRGDNPDVDFNGLNRMGNDGSGNGLKFDAGLEPDYYLTFACGEPAGPGSFATFASFAELLTDGGGGGAYIGSGGAGANALIAANGIRIAINNSNTGGVSATEVNAPSEVNSGIELAIPLALVGAPDYVHICAFINGEQHDYVSNQSLPGMNGTGNPGEPRALDLHELPGAQFVSVGVQPPPLACPMLYAINFNLHYLFQSSVVSQINAYTAATSSVSPGLLAPGIGHTIGLELGPDGFLYTVTTLGGLPTPNALYRINPYTGLTQMVGAGLGLNSVFEGDIAFDAAGVLYGIGNRNSSQQNELFRINLNTGVAYDIVALPGIDRNISFLAFSGGTLYGIDTTIAPGTTTTLLAIDPTTGAVLSSRRIWPNLGSVGGMDDDPLSGILYVADSNVAGTYKLYALNPISGVMTLVGAHSITPDLSGIAFCNSCAPAAPPVCPTNVVSTTYWGGNDDGFAPPVEPSAPRPGLAVFCSSGRDFDDLTTDHCFAHTFSGLMPNITSATLELHMRSTHSLSTNDTMDLGYLGSTFAWGRHIGTSSGQSSGMLPSAWSNGSDATILLNLAALPNADGTCTDILPTINSTRRLDLYAQDDTAFDYAKLTVTACVCDDSGPFFSWTLGIQDNFSPAGSEPAPPSSALLAAFPSSTWKPFDNATPGDRLGVRFTGIPSGVVGALLETRMRPNNYIPANDTLSIGLVPGWPPGQASWSETIAALPGAGNWAVGDPAQTFVLDLCNLPADINGVTNVLGKLADGYLDVWVENDTTVDYMKLVVRTCDACPGDLNGDTQVNLNDLATLLAHFGLGGTGQDGDINGDGLVDLSDLALLLAHFGTTC